MIIHIHNRIVLFSISRPFISVFVLLVNPTSVVITLATNRSRLGCAV